MFVAYWWSKIQGQKPPVKPRSGFSRGVKPVGLVSLVQSMVPQTQRIITQLPGEACFHILRLNEPVPQGNGKLFSHKWVSFCTTKIWVRLFSMISTLTVVNFLLISKWGCQNDLKLAACISFGEEGVGLFLELEATVSSQEGGSMRWLSENAWPLGLGYPAEGGGNLWIQVFKWSLWPPFGMLHCWKFNYITLKDPF